MRLRVALWLRGSGAGLTWCRGAKYRGAFMRFGLRYGGDRRALRAFAERQELVRAGLTRRDLVRMGLMTGGGVGGGLLATEKSLARELRSPSALGALPPLRPFVDPLPILPELPQRSASELVPAPSDLPHTDVNPATGVPFEGRSERHQSEAQFPPQAFFMTRMGAN